MNSYNFLTRLIFVVNIFILMRITQSSFSGVSEVYYAGYGFRLSTVVFPKHFQLRTGFRRPRKARFCGRGCFQFLKP